MKYGKLMAIGEQITRDLNAVLARYEKRYPGLHVSHSPHRLKLEVTALEDCSVRGISFPRRPQPATRAGTH